MQKTIANKNRLGLLRAMLRIRRTQEMVHDRYLDNMMHTPVHLCIGQEAIAVGVCAALRLDDVISSNHRGHGHYLAKGGDLNALIAELHGRETGCSGGYGGSMHLVAPEVGHLGSSSIVGGGIPIGTGHALAFSLQKSDRVSVVFFGDGASEEGVFYESCNFAILKRLPVVYVLENNEWAVCSPRKSRQTGDNVFHSGVSRGLLLSLKGDGNDVDEVHQLACQSVARARAGNGPSFIEFQTYRIPPHAGCKTQDVSGYRSEDEVAAWTELCPVKRYIHRLRSEGLLSDELLAQWEDEIALELDQAFTAALAAPFPAALHKSQQIFHR